MDEPKKDGRLKKDRRHDNPGRPEKPIDWEEVDRLLIKGCLGTEIAPRFNLHPNTFYARVEEKYKVNFTQYSCEKKAQGESILREVQFDKAIGATDKGDNTLLIWLGKQRLDQKETQQISVAPETTNAMVSMMEQLNELQGKRKSSNVQTETQIPIDSNRSNMQET